MFSTPTKLFFVLAAVALVFGVAAGVVVGGRAPVVLLMSLLVVALFAGLATYGAKVPDRAPAYSEAVAPEYRPVVDTGQVGPSAWPVVGAAAAALLAVGAATGGIPAWIGVGAAALAFGGWFAQSWREHPSWSPVLGERVSTRLALPIALPVLVIALTAVIVTSISRIFLALPKLGSTFVALAVAVVLLAGFSLLALRPRLGSGALTGLAAIAGLSAIGAGVAGAVAGERHFEHHGEELARIEVVAEGTAFTESEIRLPALEAGSERRIEIDFQNLDEEIYHNVSLYEDEEATLAVYTGEPLDGIDDIRYEITGPLAAGEYEFRCDFHENMVGTAVVEEGGDFDQATDGRQDQTDRDPTPGGGGGSGTD